MKNVLIVALLFGWVSTSLAEGDSDIYMTMDGDGIEGSYPEYEDICEGEGVREPSMSDREYADFIIEFQKTECAFTFEVGGTGFGGGTVFYVTDKGHHGLEIAPGHFSGIKWGCYGGSVKGAMKENIGSGQENTNEVLSKCEIGSKEYTSFELVDRYEENGFDDWYVPSILELHEIYDALGELEMSTHAGYYDKYFWSSTNENSTYAHSRNLVNGHKVYAKKELALSILPIRSF